MYAPEDILACAKDIRSSLPSMLGDAAEAVDVAITTLVQRYSQGEDVSFLILQALASHEESRKWTLRYLTGETDSEGSEFDRSYEPPPPGNAQAVPASRKRYFCPKCGISIEWVRREAGQIPPAVCPDDQKTLLRPSDRYSEEHYAD